MLRRDHPPNVGTCTRIVSVLLATALVALPARAATRGPAAPPTSAGAETSPTSPTSGSEAEESSDEGDEPEDEGSEPPQPEPPHTIGGVAGNPTRASNEEATQAQEDLEGKIAAGPDAKTPRRMKPLETGAWWTAFGTVVLATMAGVFSGLAEKREDEAVRLATEVDVESGMQLPYGEHAREYEDLIDEGNTYQWTARGFLIASGVGLVAAITLFAVNARRNRRGGQRARLGPAGVEVSF